MKTKVIGRSPALSQTLIVSRIVYGDNEACSSRACLINEYDLKLMINGSDVDDIVCRAQSHTGYCLDNILMAAFVIDMTVIFISKILQTVENRIGSNYSDGTVGRLRDHPAKLL